MTESKKKKTSETLRLAEEGDPKAQVKLGMWYENTDPYEASKWYKAAAEQGCAQAQYLLGLY